MYTDSGGGNMSAYGVRAYEEYPQLMPRWGYVAAAFALFLIGFFGFFLNLLVILLMFKDRQLWTPLNMILFNLVCSDFSVSVLGNPFTLISALFHRWVFGHNMCVLYGFFMALLGITSITTLTVLAFERYMMVSRPFSARHLTPRGACLTVLFIWSYSLALTTPPLFGWGNYVSEAANISCSVNWQEQTFNTLTYILFLFAMGQAVPCAVIGFSYYNIVRTMKQVSPSVGVIPALVAKSSICYDPLIYVGMNTQFRSSIKRMFGIHSKEVTSNAEPGLDRTVVSATDNRSKLNVSVTANSKNHKKNNKHVTILEARSEVIKYQKGDYNVYNSTDPSVENKTSETDRSDSDNEHKSKTTEDLYQYDTRPLAVAGKFAVLRILDEADIKTRSDQDKAIYKNRAFEDATEDNLGKDARQSPDEEDRTKRLWKMRHSSSMEITRVRLDPNLRKMSIPINYDNISKRANRNGSIARSMMSRFADRGARRVETFKTSLFTPGKDDFQEDSL